MSLDFLEEELQALEKASLRRRLEVAEGAPGRVVRMAGRELINFSSNNYLGLAGREEPAEAASAALEEGTGATASRLIVGNRRSHEALERELAAFHGAESARLFGSGYLANQGVLASLAGPGDRIVSDRLNHASIIDGCRLSRAEVVVVEHGDLAHVEAALALPARRRFVVTDAVFSMDGDRAPVTALSALCRRLGASLIVDEAHSVGALGPGGRGICAEEGVVPDVLVATLGKALGAYGAYVIGRMALGEFLLNRARSFVFSTGLPALVVEAARANLELVRGAEGRRLQSALAERIDEFAEGLNGLGLLESGAGSSPIFPILVGGDAAVLRCAEILRDEGVLCQPIRPPTVPRGTARLRVALMAEHSSADLSRLLGGLDSLQSQGLLKRP